MPEPFRFQKSHLYDLNLTLLLAALILVLVIAPVFESSLFGGFLLYGVLSLTLLAGSGLAAFQRKRFLAALILPFIAVPALWISAVVDLPVLFVLSCSCNSMFCLVLAGLLLERVMRQYVSSWQSIAGAVAAYLLLGLGWATMYWATERIESEHVAFSQVDRMSGPLPSGSKIAPFSQMVYFSFVTISTLGYGDVTPQTPLTRTLAWVEAVIGQFYIAVLVARLVAELRLRREDA